ncbi:hypothetical protein PISL3812_07338 [Talaromyces islandicus]|uniref:glucan endo-1,3-beta-D-glucosidase n=1 Tax=Talaromyces islandicus TaxID=28573 RepID=A0A0U1M413_TALIS|nr:hypothetical protein PISL3812_07338 [Talaromyces islandicus]
MQRHFTWLSALILMWSQVVHLVSCYQEAGHVSGTTSVYQRNPEASVTQTTTSFTTLYPPRNQYRVLEAQTQGVYNAQLEREGHPALLPFPLPLLGLGVSGNVGGVTSTPASSSSSWTTTVVETDKVTVPFNPTSSATTISTSVSQGTETTATSLPNPPAGQKSTTRAASPVASMNQQDVFNTVSLDAVPTNIATKDDHPVPKLGIVNTTSPIETNKFYANFFLGNQTTSSFIQPYSLSWAGGSGGARSWGLVASHTDLDQLVYGNTSASLPGNPVEYYLNPIGLQPLILSAAEFGNSTVLNTDRLTGFSAEVILQPSNGSTQSIRFPIVQGMGFVTGVYWELQPFIQSSILFRNVVQLGSPRPGTYKFQITLEDSKSWLMYVTPDDGLQPTFNFTTSSTTLAGPAGFCGTIQIAKNPAGAAGEAVYDQSAGVYATTANISGSVTDATGTYRLSWEKAGRNASSAPLLMFAFPHHIQSFDETTKQGLQPVQLRSTTKGNTTAVLGDSWTMVEQNLPVDMDFAPWSPALGSVSTLSAENIQTIMDAAKTELTEDVDGQSNVNSMYYGGKVLSKFATLVYTVNTLANDPQSAAATLDGLKKAFARFVNNEQQFPLVYDNVWKGVVSSAAWETNDLNQDFGNSGYNDHHFHYGYFIHAAAIIGALDPSWIEPNKAWVNMLVRDAGNPATDDPFFPFSRAFDWFHGHSWAKGLFVSGDGKDEESTSEDAMFAYAVKMWGKTTGDKSMEARGNLMLAILRRTLSNYFLMEDDNINQPNNFVNNRVTGILFENKAHHTTYFGANLEYIQGIHMLPLLPSSAYTRNQTFVQQEWDSMFAENACTPASSVTSGGWKGVLYANRAITNPDESYEFFKQPDFDQAWIDGGATPSLKSQVRRQGSLSRTMTGFSSNGSLEPGERQPLLNHHGSIAPSSESPYLRDPRFWVRIPAQFGYLTWATLASNYVNVLLVFVPLGIVSGVLEWGAATVFTLNFFAIMPLASLLSFATEELAATMGQTLGGLMNATFGNAVELIVSIIALKDNQIRVVQASMLGSILSNILLVLGCCFLIGGLRYSEQKFNSTVASTMSSLMTVASASLIIPASLFAAMSDSRDTSPSETRKDILLLSRGTAIILLLLYVMYLFFQLKSHAELFEAGADEEENISQRGPEQTEHTAEPAQHEEEEHILNPFAAGVALIIVTILVAICAEYLVGSIEGIVEKTGMSKTFIGLVLIPIVGNAAEHVTAVVVAYKNKMDLAVGVAIGSSLQIALFVTPFLVVLGWFMGAEMTLHFQVFETVSFFISALVVILLIQDGKSNYLEGGLCLGMYAILAIAFYVYPDSAQ